MGTNYIDAHCHYFNGAYALKEAVGIGWNWLRGNYPHRKPVTKMAGALRFLGMPSIEGWVDLMKYVARLVATINRTCLENYDYEQERFANSGIGSNKSLITAPLMMDIYYIFDNGEEDTTSVSRAAILPELMAEEFIAPHLQPDFHEYLKRVKADVEEQLPLEAKAMKFSMGKSAEAGLNLDRMLKDIEDEFTGERPIRKMLAQSLPRDVEMSKGYAGEIADLQKVGQGRETEVFPFLAVDPRRMGIMNLVVQHVGKGKNFAGIKLYPPLGYLPSHPNLYPVYDYCIKNDVPITVHCSDGGFPTPLKRIYVRSTEERTADRWVTLNRTRTASRYFADPKKWRVILEDNRYRNLRVNFAHFGGMNQVLDYVRHPQKKKWPTDIIALMKDFPNVYADLSFCPHKKIVEAVEKIAACEPLVNERLLFGTDFIMIMFDKELGGLENYFNRFVRLALPMFTDNPKRFLGI